MNFPVFCPLCDAPLTITTPLYREDHEYCACVCNNFYISPFLADFVIANNYIEFKFYRVYFPSRKVGVNIQFSYSTLPNYVANDLDVSDKESVKSFINTVEKLLLL
mgnify:CR=1 FL=1